MDKHKTQLFFARKEELHKAVDPANQFNKDNACLGTEVMDIGESIIIAIRYLPSVAVAENEKPPTKEKLTIEEQYDSLMNYGITVQKVEVPESEE